MKKRLQRICSLALLCALLATTMAVPASAASTGFSDVPASHWAATEIRRAADLGLFQGQTATRFGASGSMTRGAFAVVLCRFFGWELVKPETGSYTDNQDTTAWYYSAVETAYAHGAITNQTETFRPGDAITREELAVMLVRALGYGTIAALAQDRDLPFTDVRTAAGYIAMAYDMGIVSGTSATTFSPDRTATRAQVAVILVRLYDKYHAAAPARTGILTSGQAGDLSGFDAVAVAAQKIIYAGGTRLVDDMQSDELAAARAAAEASGARELLYVSGTATALRGTAGETASLLAAAVTEGGYDGLYLDLAGLTTAGRRDYASLAQSLRTALGSKLLYLGAEAPVWDGDSPTGYDYAALGQSADKLVLRVASYEKLTNGFPTAPLEPLEEVYYALAEVKDLVAPGKLSLALTTTGVSWVGTRQEGVLTAAEVQALRESIFTQSYFSARYGCAYLTDDSQRQTRVVWYLDGPSVAQRAQMAALFGVGQLCFADLGSVADYEGYSLLENI